MFFDNTSDLARILVVGPLAYLWHVDVLMASGKRTWAQLNAVDFIVTVALGSTVATVALSRSVSWTEGDVALALLAALQFVVARLSGRVPGFQGAGIGGLELVAAVVLEPNGTIGVVPGNKVGSGSALTMHPRGV